MNEITQSQSQLQFTQSPTQRIIFVNDHEVVHATFEYDHHWQLQVKIILKFVKNKKYVLWNVYLPNVVRWIPYTVIEIFEYNCNDLELDRFKIIQGQR